MIEQPLLKFYGKIYCFLVFLSFLKHSIPIIIFSQHWESNLGWLAPKFILAFEAVALTAHLSCHPLNTDILA